MGTPLAMTAFNAVLPDIVQVGGVFVPRGLRNRGLGRRVVAAHLTAAATAGVSRAVLFAASDAAARAYTAIGFERAGSYRLSLLDDTFVERRAEAAADRAEQGAVDV